MAQIEQAEQEKHFDFDFKKIVSHPIKKIENQTYKKVFFLAIGLSVFMTLGLSFKEAIHNKMIKSDAVESKKTSISLQEIKKMSDGDFEAMLSHVMKNTDIYDEKVHFIQTVIAKSEIEYYSSSMGTIKASILGNLLDTYKQKLILDTSELVLIRKNVINDLSISSKEADLFFKYQTLYKTKSVVHFLDLENKMQDLLYSNNQGNNTYNNKYNVYDTIKTYDTTINNTFNVISTPKPKM